MASDASLGLSVDQGIALHRVLAEAAPDDPLIAYRLGLLLAQRGFWAESIEPLTRAVRGDPSAVAHWDAWLRNHVHEHGAEGTLIQLQGLPAEGVRQRKDFQKSLGLALLSGGRPDLAFAHAREAFGDRCVGLMAADDFSGVYSIAIQFRGDAYLVRFARNFLYWPFLIDRLFALQPYIDRFAAAALRQGEARVSIGDGPDGPDRQVCFSSGDPSHWLIPDPLFLASGGYQHVRQLRLKRWLDRIDRAYWRGSLTGNADRYDTIMALPRVELALLGLHHTAIDAKITDLSQFGPWLPTLQFMLEGLDVTGPPEPIENNLHYRYLIDVDGNTNSWPGLFTKLLMGGLVLKVRSSFRQWYYDRLEAESPLVFVDTVSALPEALDAARASPEASVRRAKEAMAFALKITPGREYESFSRTMALALA